MKGQKTVMAVSCHPADAVDLAGGTLYNHVQNGDRVVIVNMTHGAYSHAALQYDNSKSEYSSEEELYKAIIEVKHDEAIKAASCVGVREVINLGYDDEPLIISREHIWGMAEMIREYKPEILITHHPNEYTHEDHSTCGWAMIKALKAAQRYYPGSKLPQHFVPAVYFFGVQSRPRHFKLAYLTLAADVLVDIENAVEAKIKAFCEIYSQKNNESVARDRLNSMERETGRIEGLLYAESFISFYPLKVGVLPTNVDASFYKLQDRFVK